MANDHLTIRIENLDHVIRGLRQFPKQIERNLGQAGDEAANRVIFQEVGVKRYPPATAANRPPVPYYIRGRGTQYANRNLMNSERYGTKWTVRQTSMRTDIGNSASYSKYLGGNPPARHMEAIGWKSLAGTAEAKLDSIRKVYQSWIDRLIRQLGL